MRRILYIGLAVFCIPLYAFAQGYVFGPNIRVSDYSPGTAYAYTPNAGQRGVAVRGDTVYCTWDDNRIGGWGVWFSKSIDGGQTFLPNVQVDDGLDEAYTPTIAVGDDGTIYIAWDGIPAPFTLKQVFFSKSTDGGLTFTPDVLVNDTANGIKNHPHRNPSMAVDSAAIIYIAFDDARNDPLSKYDIYFSKSTDSGLTFTQDVLVNDTIPGETLNATRPALALSDDGDIYCSWSKQFKWLYACKSTDGGISFSSDVQVNDTVTESWTNSIDVDSRGYVHVVWNDRRDDNWNIYYSHSTDGGLTFNPNIRVNDAAHEPDPQAYPSMCVDDDGMVYAVWEEGSALCPDIYYTLSTDNGDSSFVEPNVLVDETDSSCFYPSVAVGDSEKVYVLWADFRIGWPLNDVYFAMGRYESGVKEETVKGEEGRVSVSAPFPNPFSDRVEIKYCIGHPDGIVETFHGTSSAEGIELKVYDLSGRLIKQLINREKNPGVYTTIWQGDDESGKSVPQGVYFIRGKIGEQEVSEKLLKIK